MGFLKNLIRNAVEEGVTKGIRDAVSSAAEKIVAPKAEAYANSVADSLDEAAQAMNSAAQAGAESAKKEGSSLERAAERLSQSAEAYAKAMETAASGISEWNEKLPGFPLWCFGGKEFSIDENYTSDEGTTYYIFSAVGATPEDMHAYIDLLKTDGFVQKYKDSDQVLYKDLGGEYLVFRVVMMNAAGEVDPFRIFFKCFEVSARTVAFVVVEDVGQGVAQAYVPGAVLVPVDVPAPFGRLAEVVGVCFLIQRQRIPPGDGVADDFQVGELVDRVFESAVAFFSVFAACPKCGDADSCHQD